MYMYIYSNMRAHHPGNLPSGHCKSMTFLRSPFLSYMYYLLKRLGTSTNRSTCSTEAITSSCVFALLKTSTCTQKQIATVESLDKRRAKPSITQSFHCCFRLSDAHLSMRRRGSPLRHSFHQFRQLSVQHSSSDSTVPSKVSNRSHTCHPNRAGQGAGTGQHQCSDTQAAGIHR